MLKARKVGILGKLHTTLKAWSVGYTRWCWTSLEDVDCKVRQCQIRQAIECKFWMLEVNFWSVRLCFPLYILICFSCKTRSRISGQNKWRQATSCGSLEHWSSEWVIFDRLTFLLHHFLSHKHPNLVYLFIFLFRSRCLMITFS